MRAYESMMLWFIALLFSILISIDVGSLVVNFTSWGK
jgi:hypothetical protein